MKILYAFGFLFICDIVVCMFSQENSAHESVDSVSVKNNILQILDKFVYDEQKMSFSTIGIDTNDGSLYVNAFNVGQANFILLKKKNKAVIIDAGVQSDDFFLESSAAKLDELLRNTIVEAVFITHPHDDHYSMFISKRLSLFNIYKDAFKDTCFFLGGTLDDWTSEKQKTFINNIPIGKLKFSEESSVFYVFLEDVSFNIFNIEAPVRRSANKLSTIVQVSFIGKNILFTGDAEGDSISRLFQNAIDLSSIKHFVQTKETLNNVDIVAHKFHTYVDQYFSKHEKGEAFSQFSREYWETYNLVNTEMNNALPDIQSIFVDFILENAIIPDQNFSKLFNDNISQIFDSYIENSQFLQILIDQSMVFIDDIAQRSKYAFQQRYLNVFGLEKYSVKKAQEFLLYKIKSNNIKVVKDMFILFKDQIIDEIKNNTQFLQCMRWTFWKDAIQHTFGDETLNTTMNEFLWQAQQILTEQLVRISAIRKLFKGSHIIILPHHGTNTDGSQNFLGFFAGRKEPHLFIVSSSPFGSSGLPHASTLDMAPSFPEHSSHPFLYCRDLISPSGTAQISWTTKPIYLTGAAQAGAITIKITTNGDVLLLDMLKRDQTTHRWINALQ